MRKLLGAGNSGKILGTVSENLRLLLKNCTYNKLKEKSIQFPNISIYEEVIYEKSRNISCMYLSFFLISSAVISADTAPVYSNTSTEW